MVSALKEIISTLLAKPGFYSDIYSSLYNIDINSSSVNDINTFHLPQINTANIFTGRGPFASHMNKADVCKHTPYKT